MCENVYAFWHASEECDPSKAFGKASIANEAVMPKFDDFTKRAA